MVNTINDIEKNKCVLVQYFSDSDYYIVLWNYDSKTEYSFNSPYVRTKYDDTFYNGSFRLNDGCKYVRDASVKEIVKLQQYLNQQGIDYLISTDLTYELW